MSSPLPTRLPIAHVQTLTESGRVERRSHVECPRRHGSVDTDVCAHCPRFIKVQAGDTENADAVLCFLEDEHSGPQPPPSGTLKLARLSVGALMTRNVVCVRPELSLDLVTTLFVEHGLKALPVVEASGKLLGFVTEVDVLLEVQTVDQSGVTRIQKTVGDLTMPYALALPETMSVTQAAAVLAFEGQHRAAVVSRTGALVGVLSASDILYWLARADGHLLPRPRER